MGVMEPAIDFAWLRESNAVAASIPRGTSTPESRRDHLLREYERVLSSVAASSVSPPRSVADREGSVPWSDDSSSSEEREPFGKFEQAAYGAGRELEKAIQVARFGHVTGNCHGEWLRGLHK
jgi:hypothetical protein